MKSKDFTWHTTDKRHYFNELLMISLNNKIDAIYMDIAYSVYFWVQPRKKIYLIVANKILHRVFGENRQNLPAFLGCHTKILAKQAEGHAGRQEACAECHGAWGMWKSTPSEEQVLALAHLRSPSHMLDTILWAIFKCTENIRRKYMYIYVMLCLLKYNSRRSITLLCIHNLTEHNLTVVECCTFWIGR